MINSARAATIESLITAGVLIINDGYRAKNEELGPLGLPFARAGNINNGFHFENADKFPEANLNRVGLKVSRPGDVVFTSKGTVGRFAFVRQDTPRFIFSPQLCFWRVLDTRAIDPRFLYYWMHGSECRRQFDGVKGQTDMADFVSLRDQRAMIIHLPEIHSQCGISSVLGSLDDKIELNRRTNETLEAMARTLFRSWFVDFDPVRAKADGQQPHGMGAAAAELFPDSFEPSALGPIPSGWKVLRLPEAITVNPSRSLSKDTVAPYLEMGNMPTALARALAWEPRPCGSGAKFINGDVLLARITPCLENGKTAFVDFLDEGRVGWGSTEYIVFRSKPPLPPEFAYFLARSPELRTHAIRNMTGTSGRQRVPAECFNSFLIIVPPAQIAAQFGEWCKPIMAMLKALDEESVSLIRIRDVLLPKLLSGEKQIGDQEQGNGSE